jgi:adenylosuccinate lyase
MTDFEKYQSSYSWRYGSNEMRGIWSEIHKRRLWREMWISLAETQAGYGVITQEQLADLQAHRQQVDVGRALEIEAEIQHDLMAELKAFAEQCPLGGGALHLGATSTDIEDNADTLRVRQSLDLILERLQALLLSFADRIERWAEMPVMAYTHLQPAEPSTLGYRLAQSAQDLLMDWEDLRRARRNLRGKGFKGAVGTSASYADLIGVENLAEFEIQLSTRLGLPFFPVTTQTSPRKQDYRVIAALAGLGGSVYKFAFDLRLLQAPGIGEMAESFGKRQIGSSAMPFKRNPINAERINSLGRVLAQMPRLAWDNAANSLLERTLDDSANRRTLLPESFLITDELVQTCTKILDGLQVNQTGIERNLRLFGPFAATERVLMALGKAGADRQAMHERLRQHALAAWDRFQAGEPNPLIELVCQDSEFLRYIEESEMRSLMDASHHLGDAPQRARYLAETIRQAVA